LLDGLSPPSLAPRPEQRRPVFALSPEPPRWCIDMHGTLSGVTGALTLLPSAVIGIDIDAGARLLRSRRVCTYIHHISNESFCAPIAQGRFLLRPTRARSGVR
jgi:hypothetical protein